MHSEVAEPGKKQNMPQAKLFLPRSGDPVPDFSAGHLKEVAQVGMYTQSGEHNDRACNKNNKYPWRTDLSEPAEPFKTQNSENGEQEAGRLARRLGGMADQAKDLAFRLYGIADQKGWTEEALGYNALVATWPDIQKAAAALVEETQGRMV